MEENHWDKLERLFSEALSYEQADRVAFLDEACGENKQLRDELDGMLASHKEQAALSVERSLLAHEQLPTRDSDLVERHIGSYRLLEVIGEGGMGVVYKAERSDGAFRQTVALKLVRKGAYGAEMQARFRQERQVLARLSHPHIVPLLDGGISAEGWPYLAMKYVDGEPITAFCDQNRLTIQERLKLFKTVCKAVQHAHNSLIVHRDIKPTNILVTDEDQVQLLDFGIAKILDPEDQEESIAVTQSHVRLLTPEYASPEQVRGEAIATATDVYALGVLLYELLTGNKPYTFENKSITEIERVICEEYPPRPSIVIGRGGDTESNQAISEARKLTTQRLQRQLQGDLDNIVMMALRKEPERRYMSAGQLAEDIDRYLLSRPVLAQKDTLRYRVQKFVRRNKTGVFLTSGLFALSIMFSIITTVQAKRVALERDKAEEVTRFMMTLFESSDPRNEPNDSLRVTELLERGVKRLDLLNEKPETQIELMDVLSEAYWGLGQFEASNNLYESALARSKEVYGPTHENSLDFMLKSGTSSRMKGDIARSDSFFQQLLPLYLENYGEDDTRSIVLQYRMAFNKHSMGQWAAGDSLLAMLEPAFQYIEHEDNRDVSQILSHLSEYYEIKGPPEKALAYVQMSIEMKRRLFGPQYYGLLHQRTVLTRLLVQLDRLEEAESNAVETLAALREVFTEHAILGYGLEGLGVVYEVQQRFAEAEPLYLEALEQYRAIYTEENPIMSHILIVLGRLYHEWGKYEPAIDYYGQGLTLSEQTYPAHFPTNLARQILYAQILKEAGRLEEALETLLRTYNVATEKYGPENRYTLQAKEQIVALYKSMGEDELASDFVGN